MLSVGLDFQLFKSATIPEEGDNPLGLTTPSSPCQIRVDAALILRDTLHLQVATYAAGGDSFLRKNILSGKLILIDDSLYLLDCTSHLGFSNLFNLFGKLSLLCEPAPRPR